MNGFMDKLSEKIMPLANWLGDTEPGYCTWFCATLLCWRFH